MPIQTFPLLLADIEGFFGIVFFLIAFVGWVINLVSQNQEKSKNERKPPVRQGRSGSQRNPRKEIDQFLSQSKRSSNRSRQNDLDEVEVIAPPAQRRPPRRRRSRQEILADQAQSRTPQLEKKQPKHSPRPGEDVSSRHLATLATQREERPPLVSHVAEQVAEHLSHGVDKQVASHLDVFTAAGSVSSGRRGMASTTTARKSQGTLIGSLLRSKSGVRNAIILNEILSPPKSLRK